MAKYIFSRPYEYKNTFNEAMQTKGEKLPWYQNKEG